jgi:hypothetical protein
MGFSSTVEATRSARRAPAAHSKRDAAPPRQGVHPLALAAVAGAVLLPLAAQLGWLRAAERALARAGVRLPWRRGGDDEDDGDAAGGGGGGTRSAFRFPKSAPASMANVPRNKQSNNKKSKSRKAGARALRAPSRAQRRQRAAAAAAPYSLAQGLC